VTKRVAFFLNIPHSQALVGKAEGQFQKAFGEANKTVKGFKVLKEKGLNEIK